MDVLAYWTPTDRESRGHIDLRAETQQSGSRRRLLGGVYSDPEWTTVAEASNAGPILGGIEREYMIATDYSPLQ